MFDVYRGSQNHFPPTKTIQIIKLVTKKGCFLAKKSRLTGDGFATLQDSDLQNFFVGQYKPLFSELHGLQLSNKLFKLQIVKLFLSKLTSHIIHTHYDGTVGVTFSIWRIK